MGSSASSEGKITFFFKDGTQRWGLLSEGKEITSCSLENVSEVREMKRLMKKYYFDERSATYVSFISLSNKVK